MAHKGYKKKNAQSVHCMIRVTKDTMKRIDTLVHKMNKKAPGAGFLKSNVIRRLIAIGLNHEDEFFG